MTYCLAIALKTGLVFVSDSRTNAGVDNVSTHSKMHTFGDLGERQFVVLSAGNLATTQSVIGKIKSDLRNGADGNLMSVTSIREAADYIGRLNVAAQKAHAEPSPVFEASFIVGGQIRDHKSNIRLVYPAGNHIEASKSAPYLQIGESKYGKPILDRIIDRSLSLETATSCALVSMDSTMRSNLSVGPPIEILVYEVNSLSLDRRYLFNEDSEYLRQIRKSWDAALISAFKTLPPIAWGTKWDEHANEDVD